MPINIVKRPNGDVNKIECENVRLIWTNFAGREGKYNPAGNRNFNIVLEESDAKMLQDLGLNVKFHEGRDENDPGIYTLQIKINFKSYNPPEIWMKNSHGNAQLDEDSVKMLDPLVSADAVTESWLSFNLNHYEQFTTAYLQKLLVTVQESDYEARFFDEPDSAMNTMTFHKVEKD